MEILKNEVLFSRQGKASIHFFANLNLSPKRKAKIKEPEPLPAAGIKGLLESIEKELEDEEKAKANKPQKCTASFVSVSREQRDHAYRNKTESPKVGRYTPKYNVIDPRINQAPKIKEKIGVPRQRKIFIPACVDDDLNCSFPAEYSKTSIGYYDNKLSRTIYNLNDYQDKFSKQSESVSPIPEKPGHKIKSPLDFKIQKPRDPFVKSSNPPNELRFEFYASADTNNSKHKRSRTVAFDKMIPRKDLHKIGETPGPYNKNEEKLMPRLNFTLIDFNKNPARKPLIHEHILRTPHSPDLERYDRAFYKQSTIRGAYHIPTIKSLSPRDDMMYKTTEAYNLNLLGKNFACPKFQEDGQESQLSN
ncbi:unnamed protein product [Blepharisma stoltei]|uniref:Uncharacterized protein n=1 Tax=Blepharisma stoltei TaxID=1481888 RepID=A0AAU9JWE5_9CILI|nr:unnamed protein product [Blepharisma stoltei]